MIFSEMPYYRVDIPAAIATTVNATEALCNASTPEEAVAVVLSHHKYMEKVLTMIKLSYIRYTQDTQDSFYTAEELYYAEQRPALNEKIAAFNSAMVESPFHANLADHFGKTAILNSQILKKTICSSVLSDLGEENALSLEYQKVQGGMRTLWQGREIPVAEMDLYMNDADRSIRRQAFYAVGETYTAAAPQLESIFDRMVRVRTKIAHGLGLSSFTELGYLRMMRNSYSRNQVDAFRHQVKEILVPLQSELKCKQAQRLGISRLMVYDEGILTPAGNPRPQKIGEELYHVGVAAFSALAPEAAELINEMADMQAFDLYAREGKMTGGYCESLPQYKIPFIFANFDGTAGDVEVFTHEGGHAFADAMGLRSDPPELTVALPTLDICECHSMSMEFLFWPLLELFYGAEAERARIIHLLKALKFIPYGCMVDEFQHIVYDRPELTPEQRNGIWLELEQQYRPDLDGAGLPLWSDGRRWQKQLHIFTDPFYYIDYALAQTVALQFWNIMQIEGHDAAWNKYVAFASCGGKLPFTEVVAAAGLKSPFEEGALYDIVETAKRYLDRHMAVLS